MEQHRKVRLRFTPRRKAPKEMHGDGVYECLLDEAMPLEAGGWVRVGESKGSRYLRAPQSDAGPPFIIEASLPTRQEVLRVAEEARAGGELWAGTVGVWLARYYPQRPVSTQEVDPFTGARGEVEQGRPIPGTFIVGASQLWEAGVDWRDGDPRYWEASDNIVPEGTLQGSLFSVRRDPEAPEAEGEVRFEGALLRVEMDRYERDPVARRRCIDHHGAVCVVCSFDFGQAYGPVAGGFIHVHHLNPLSEAGGEHEVDPITDLVPVCPNCHAVIHMRTPPYTPHEVRAFLNLSGGS